LLFFVSLPCGESYMSSSDDRCPTCDGSGFVARSDQRYPCPTCSSTSDASGPYLAADPDESVHIARSAAYGLGAAALIAVLALVLKALWH
jgi:hypothetical protein